MFWKNKNKGKAMIYIDDCIGCGNCIERCPKQIIGFYEICGQRYARLMHPENCTGCGKCARACDYGAIDIMESVILCKTW